jgi:hypothetical protein
MKITDRYEPASAERFTRDTEGFEMTVLHDDGVYRHLRFRHPTEGSMYWFDLVTWPGCLTFRGDMGTWTFARELDMALQFFSEQGYANASYWSEKLQGGDGQRGAQRFSPERFREHIRQAYRDHLEAEGVSADADLWQDIHSTFMDDWAPEDQTTCIHLAAQYAWRPRYDQPVKFTFGDAWEWDCTEWDHAFLWACQGIRAGLAKYRQHLAADRPATEVA